MSSNKLRVVIVGAGFAGLTAAIECKLRGMHPILVESYPTSKNYGDVIDFFPNGGRIIERWNNGRIAARLLAVCINNGDKFQFYSNEGVLLCEENWNAKPNHYMRQLAGHRGEMHQIVIDYATEIEVEMRFGQKVTEYLDTAEELGVVTENGTKILGDVVLACDGPRSLARSAVLGLADDKVNSGYAIYRAFFTVQEEHKNNPLFQHIANSPTDVTKMWVGRDVHALLYTWNKGKDVGWVLTHKDDHDIGESWSFPGYISDALAYLDEAKMEDTLKEIVRLTPPSQLVDYKLVWREPLKTWLSRSKRIAVIGDAAHCHLPSSGQGGSQALEDGVAIAVALQRAQGDVKLALQVFERIRFNRSHVIHMSSVSNRDDYHNVEWTKEFVEAHPNSLTIPRYDWVMEHDAAANAEEHFEQLAEDVRSGKEGTIEELALPAGGSFEVVYDKTTKVKKEVEVVPTAPGPVKIVA